MTIYYLYVKTHNITGLKYLGYTKRKDPYKYKGSGKYWIKHIKKHEYDVTTEILKECLSKDEIKEWGLYYSNLWNIVESRDNNGNKTWANLKPEDGDGGQTAFGDMHPMKNPKHRVKISGENHYSKKTGYVWKLSGDYHPMKNPDVLQKITGLAHYSYDYTIYNFYHKSGIIEKCTTSQLREKYNIGVYIRQVILGKAKSYKGWRITPELKPHASKGINKSDDHRKSLSSAKTGKKTTIETKRRQSIVKKGKPKPKISCPYCQKTGGAPQMKRYHFDNCKILKDKDK
jgi:hypothetical protein